ncbi:hypothetical protein OV090_42865 [Nannocystis sp. RBIL2]|uniref:hypothetical protein n=1 Tax=Nannocystis sp. RBIL2 TaxID=2996788 RepID=UPI00226EDCE5|nr:hypothetical protein [Nannocystis sp. RBIL2]MCY1071563.1 hypothetical protein [Nannocystis sp. RBIL2]
MGTALLSCGDDSATSTESDTATDERVLRISEAVELCTVTPSPSSPLFHARAILRLDEGEVSLPAEPDVDTPTWLPFTLRTGPDGPELPWAEGEGAVSVAADSVPHSIYFLDEAYGWETVVYVDNPNAMTVRGDRLLVQVAYPAGTRVFELAPITTLDQELRLRVLAFVPGLAATDPPQRTLAAPCELTDVSVDRIDVTLAEGAVSFHTRPARWGGLDGFTVLAEGEVDGVPFEVDSYWDLEYATSNVEGLYGVSPRMAVRFGERPDGSCILLVEPDPFAPEPVYFASVLDCAQNKLRDLSLQSIAFVAGGGENRW